jgi:hypothetical protein
MDRRDLDEPGVGDVRDEAWYQAVQEIRDLRHDGEYAWAEATLARIEISIKQSHRVTEGQQRAIARIRSGEWASGRAYDAWGYGRRWR